jgi:soluble lytic murein transglycosylase-like protein
MGAAMSTEADAWGYADGECLVSERFPEDVRRWCGWISTYAREANLPPDLVAALIWQESGGNPRAYSHSGAVGLMQVMPRNGIAEKFRCKGIPCFEDRPTIAELENPEFNIQFGTGYLKSLVKEHHGDLREALRSYGPMDVGYSYADTVLSIYNRYRFWSD